MNKNYIVLMVNAVGVKFFVAPIVMGGCFVVISVTNFLFSQHIEHRIRGSNSFDLGDNAVFGVFFLIGIALIVWGVYGIVSHLRFKAAREEFLGRLQAASSIILSPRKGLCYVTGLPVADLAFGDMLDLCYAQGGGSLEIWSAKRPEQPIWKLSLNGVSSKRGRTSQQHGLTAFLKGIDAQGNPPKMREIEFLFASFDTVNAFHAMVEQAALLDDGKQSSAEWIGKKQAGEQGERMVREQVKRQLGGSYVDGVIPTENMAWRGRHFEIDLLCLCSGIGLVLMEIKNFAGTVRFRGESECLQTKLDGGEYRPDMSPVRQALRAKEILESLLRENNLDFPVVPLVVMANPDVALAVEEPDSRCAVVKQAGLAAWFERQPHFQGIAFSKQDFDAISAMLKAAEREYGR